MEIQERYVTVAQAAEMLNKTVSWVGRVCRAGGFPKAEKVGSSWLIPREAVANYTPQKRGVKPGTTKKQRLAEERERFLEESKL